MNQSSVSSTTLIGRLRMNDHSAWQHFVEVYAPLIFRFACRQGLNEPDAQDFAQETMLSMSQSIQKGAYERRPGSRLRSWVWVIVNRAFLNCIKKKNREITAKGGLDGYQQMEQIPDEVQMSQLEWDQSYDELVGNPVVERVKARCTHVNWHAFWWTEIDGRAAQEVADVLRIKVAQVYLARSRIKAELKREYEYFDEE